MECLKTTYKLVFYFFLLPILLCGQSEELEFKVYSFEEGLSHRNVFKVRQDPEGYLWIATINGLNRFDGTRFLTYSTQSEKYRIPHDYVSDMVIGLDSLLYLAHPNALTILNPTTNQIRLVETNPESALYNLEREANGLCLAESGAL